MKKFVLTLFCLFLAGCINEEIQVPENQGTTTLIQTTQPTSSSTYSPLKASTSSSTSTTLWENPCLNISSEKDRDACVHTHALSLKRESICGYIEDEYLKVRCQAEVEVNPQACLKIHQKTQRDWCYRTIAFKKNQIKYCDEIATESIKDECLLNFLKYKEPDPLKCFEIKNTGLKDECILHHMAQGYINKDLCHLLTTVQAKNRCENQK